MNKHIIIVFILITTASAQGVFEPINSNIYDYLNRLSVKGLIEFNDEIKPIMRTELAKKIIEVKTMSSKLTKIELDELEYYMKEYFLELPQQSIDSRARIEFFDYNEQTGFRFILYRDNDFTFNLDPILGVKLTEIWNETQFLRWNGLQFYGSYNNNWKFNFYFRDNEERGNRIDRTKSFTPDPGFNLSKSDSKSIQYLEVQGLVSYSWNNGNLSIGKEYIEWGNGASGKLIFSSKAPSFPFIKFELMPIKWLKFIYLHGWLHSGLLDSSSIRTTLVKDRESYSQIEKYIAAHIVSIYPSDNFSFSVGESMVYSNRLQLAYFIPVIFFRAVDHYLSRQSSSSGDNAQLFFSTVYKNFNIKTKFYATLFIDELSLTKLFKGENLSAIGFTAGLNFVDPLVKNSDLVVEYTRINPFVYMNSDDAEMFTSHQYQLGHWLGSNADQFYIEYNQTLLRGLRFKFWSEYIRKGQKELPEEQYKLPYPNFLYGKKLHFANFGLKMSYDVFHNLFAELRLGFSSLHDEDELRTPDYQTGKKYSLSISLGYGF